MCAVNGRGEEPQPEGPGDVDGPETDGAGHAGHESAGSHPARAAASGTGDATTPGKTASGKRRLRAWGPGGVRDLAAREQAEPAARQLYSPQRVMPAPRRGRPGTVPDWWWANRPRRALRETRGCYRPRRLIPDDLAGLSLMGPSSLRLWFVPLPGLPRRWSGD